MDKFDIPRRGTAYHGTATYDADATIAFYEGVLGFPLVSVSYEPEGTGRKAGLRNLLFDIGHNEYIAFREEEPWEGEGEDPLKVLADEFHWAFQGGNDATLEAYRERLMSKGYKVTEIVQTGVEYPNGERLESVHSIYFRDPVNDFLLEFSVMLREFTERDLDQKPWFSDNHGGPAFFEAFLGTERYQKRMAAMAAAKNS